MASQWNNCPDAQVQGSQVQEVQPSPPRPSRLVYSQAADDCQPWTDILSAPLEKAFMVRKCAAGELPSLPSCLRFKKNNLEEIPAMLRATYQLKETEAMKLKYTIPTEDGKGVKFVISCPAVKDATPLLLKSLNDMTETFYLQARVMSELIVEVQVRGKSHRKKRQGEKDFEAIKKSISWGMPQDEIVQKNKWEVDLLISRVSLSLVAGVYCLNVLNPAYCRCLFKMCPLKTKGLIKLDHPANLRNLQLHLTAHRAVSAVSADTDVLRVMIKRLHFVVSKRCGISVRFDENLAILEELNDKFPYLEPLSASSKFALIVKTSRMPCSPLICMKDSQTNHEQFL